MALSRVGLVAMLLLACGERAVLLARILPSDAAAPPSRSFTCPSLPAAPPVRAAQAYPGYLEPFMDPAHGVQITRVTGDPGTPVPRVGGVWARRTRSIFTTKQVWNADESLLYLHFGGPLLLDGRTYQVIARPPLEATPSWDPANPHRMIYVKDNDVRALDVSTGVVSVLASLTGYRDLRQDLDHDQVSLDGRFTAVTATRMSDGKQVAFVVDLTTGTKRADVVFEAHGYLRGDQRDAAVSMTGRFLRLTGTLTSAGRTTAAGYTVFDLDGRKLRELAERTFCPHVGDMGLDAEGRDGEVGRCEDAGPFQGRVVLWRYDDGAMLMGGPSSTFTSGRAYRRPGWAFVSSTMRPQLYATRIGDGLTEYFADARLVDPVDYWAQPQSVPSPSGTRVLFATNWGQGAPDDDDAASFVADFRPACR